MRKLELLLDSRDLTPLGRFCLYNIARVGLFLRGAGEMAAIMSLEEPRPRGTVLGERADRLRVSEAENFFRCNICGGYLDARDYVWVLDHEGPLPHPPQDQAQ